jgi:ribosomal protein L15E
VKITLQNRFLEYGIAKVLERVRRPTVPLHARLRTVQAKTSNS